MKLKATGSIRRMDSLGRVVIPKGIRDARGWEQGTAMEFYIGDDDVVVLRKCVPHNLGRLEYLRGELINTLSRIPNREVRASLELSVSSLEKAIARAVDQV